MSFNGIDLLLFQKFFAEKTNSKLFLEMIQIHFNKKIVNDNQNAKNNTQYELFYIIQNYLYYQINHNFLLNKKFSSKIDNVIYSESLSLYNQFISYSLDKKVFDKTPYNYFRIENKNTNNIINEKISSNNIESNINIFTNKNQLEFFLHVILIYSYYLIFVVDNKDYKTQHNLVPSIFQTNSKDFSLILDPLSKWYINKKIRRNYLNTIISFFIRYHKKYPLIMSCLNQISLEILLHLLVEYYSINNFSSSKISKFLFIFKTNNQQRIFQTVLLFNDKNGHIEKYNSFTSLILDCFITKSVNNIYNIIKIFNIQGLDKDKANKIFSNMYSKKSISESKNIKNLFFYFTEIILHCNNIKNNILGLFMIKSIEDISYSLDNEISNFYIFKNLVGGFLQKFGIKIIIDGFKINHIIDDNSNVKNNNKNKIFCSYIDKKMNNYICLLIKFFDNLIKRCSEYFFNYFDKGFLYLFDILNSLTCESNFYYMNIENKTIQQYRANILTYISLLFGYVESSKMVKEIYKYYFKPNLFLLKKKSQCAINYLNENTSIKISINKHYNFLNLCHYLSSDEYKEKTLNNIQNIFCKISPFNSLEIQSSFLECYLNELNENKANRINGNSNNNIINIKEVVIDLPKDLILSKEDEEELKKYLEKISLNTLEYRQKVIAIILEKLSNDLNYAELALSGNPIKILYLIINILSSESIIDNIDILMNCFQCLLVLYQFGKVFFDYQLDLQLISLLQQIQQKTKNKEEFPEYEILPQDFHPKISQLLTELLKNHDEQKKKKDEINNNEKNGEEQEIDIYEKNIIHLINECKKIELKNSSNNNKFELVYSLKKLINELDISPNTNKAKNISMDTIKLIIDYLNDLLIRKCYDNSFMSQNVLRVFRNLFLSIKSDENLRKYYLKLISENLYKLLEQKNFISEKEKNTKIEITSKIFELFVKIIKKLKNKSFLIGKDILNILFHVFENQQKGIYQLSPYSIVSSISICAYLIEYCHEEINQYISIIIRTGINFLKSTKSSTIEQQRASAFLLYKILDTLTDEELSFYSKEIFDACNIVQTYSNDNALLFYIKKCLDYYE